MSERILVAMSGGVDSSVAAALLASQGFEVVGVTLHLWDYPDDGSVRGRCCAPEDVHDARRVADAIGIPHYAFDRRELFSREVVQPFVDAYLSGSTPSPCVTCNRGVKMKELFALSARLECDAVATGHYARLDAKGPWPRLLRARDLEKDQSYFLHALRPSDLTRLRFPLGELSKAEVREQARTLRLPGADKGESQELCFVPTGRYDAFVAERAGKRLRPGPIVDESGAVVGTHDGIHKFTVGQRRNLGVALGRRAYVVGVDAASATVRLGDAESLSASGAELAGVRLAAGVTLPLECDVVVRYRGRPTPALVVEGRDGGARVHFQASVRAVVKGQTAVFYSGDAVLGGGTIVASDRGASAAPERVRGALA